MPIVMEARYQRATARRQNRHHEHKTCFPHRGVFRCTVLGGLRNGRSVSIVRPAKDPPSRKTQDLRPRPKNQDHAISVLSACLSHRVPCDKIMWVARSAAAIASRRLLNERYS